MKLREVIFMGRREKRMQMEENTLFSAFRKRMEFAMALFFVMIVLLLSRLAYIQLACHEAFTQAAHAQHEMPVVGLDEGYQYYCIVEKEEEDRTLYRLFGSLGARDITKESSKYSVYEMKTLDYTLGRQLQEEYHAYIFRNFAPKTKLILQADAAGRILPGLRPETQGRT